MLGGKAGLAAVGLAAVALTGAIGYRVFNADGSATTTMAQPKSIAELEAHLAKQPEDVEGWRTLGAAHFAHENFASAAQAYARAATLAPTRADLWSSMGEARVLADGSVGAEAHRAFTTALSVDPKDYRARYFLGVEKDLAGDHRAAIDDWIALVAEAPPGAPWEASVRDLIGKVASREKIDIAGRLPPPRADVATPPPNTGDAVAAAAIPGPTAEEMKAASGLTPAQQDEMVQGMVGRLAARLAADPNDADGWIRLMRARMVLNDASGARSALATARKTFASGAERQRIDDAADMLGVR